MSCPSCNFLSIFYLRFLPEFLSETLQAFMVGFLQKFCFSDFFLGFYAKTPLGRNDIFWYCFRSFFCYFIQNSCRYSSKISCSEILLEFLLDFLKPLPLGFLQAPGFLLMIPQIFILGDSSMNTSRYIILNTTSDFFRDFNINTSNGSFRNYSTLFQGFH